MKARSAVIRGLLTSRIPLSLHPGYVFIYEAPRRASIVKMLEKSKPPEPDLLCKS